MRTTPALLILLALLVSAAGLTVGAGFDAVAGSADQEDELLAPEEPILVFDIKLDAEGDAAWNVTARFPIGTEAREEAFAAVATAYTQEDPEEYLPIRPFEETAREIRDDLDRSMWVEEVERDVIMTEDTGMLVLRFEWVGFAEAELDRVTVGDAFVATEQTWLSRLGEGEYIRIHAPEGYTVESSGMPVRDRTMWMSGPADLNDEELSGTFVSGSTANEAVGGGTPLAPVLGGSGALLLALLVLFGVAYFRGWPPVVDAVDRLTDTGRPADDTAPTDEQAGAEDAGIPLDDPGLLSDEELVLELVAHNGGRMKQATIVEETDWSNAKVSQLLSQMAADGDIEKLRIGRENLITIAEEQAEE